MSTDLQNLGQLIDDKKYDEAKAVISAAVKDDLTDDEKGAALVGLASVYLNMSNNISQQYIDTLKETIDALEKLKKAEIEARDGIDLAEVRAGLDL